MIPLFILNNDLHGVPDLLHYDLIHILFNYITTISPVSFRVGKIKERQRQNYNKKQHTKNKQSQGMHLYCTFPFTGIKSYQYKFYVVVNWKTTYFFCCS